MNGKENIINKILADADNKCAEILSAAELQAQQIADAAKQAALAEKQAADKRLANLAAERRRNLKANSLLEARKYRLQKKQQLISQCYQKALAVLTKLPAEKKKALLTKLITSYAEQGETVYPVKADAQIVTQQFLDTFNLGLKLGKGFAQASGGLLLCGEGYDKDITLEKLMSHLRDQTEAKVASALFGG